MPEKIHQSITITTRCASCEGLPSVEVMWEWERLRDWTPYIHTVCLRVFWRTEDYICHAQGLRRQAIHHTHTHATWQFQHYMLCASDLESLKQKLDLTDLIDYWMVYIKTDWWMTADEMPFLVLECEDLSMKLYTVCVWLCRLAQIQYFETNTSEILQLLVPILQKECYWTHTQKKY